MEAAEYIQDHTIRFCKTAYQTFYGQSSIADEWPYVGTFTRWA